MKLRIQRETLLEPLQMVIGVVERRQTLAILSNLLLTAQNQQLSIVATDMEIELTASALLGENLIEAGQLTIPGRKLLDIVRTLPENAMIDLQQKAEQIILRSGKSRFMLTTLSVNSFPLFHVNTPTLKLTLQQKEFTLLLQRTYFAMAQQDVRHYLNGMLLDVKDNKIVTVATDGHRFAMNAHAVDVGEKTAQVILPRKAVLELLRLLKRDDPEFTIELGENHVQVRNQAFTFTSRLIEGVFPDYAGVLPKSPGNSVMVDRALFKSALVRVSILSNEKFRAVRLQVCPDALHIISNNLEQQEEAEEILSLSYTGETFQTAFNVVYILDVLNTMSSKMVRLTFVENNTRLLIEEETHIDSLFLIMPMQL